MAQKKEKFTEPHKISGLAKSEPILLAYSGGPDSSALLYMLKKYCDENSAKLYLAHVDHLIRENEHERDLEFCKKTAEKLGLEIFTETVDVPRLAKESGESLELAARRVRYEFFEKIMKEKKIRILATAHNADDNLETVIFNLIRGTGGRGASGIPEKRGFAGGYIVRPILNMTKSEIFDYCRENRIEYVVDSTNEEPDCSRNKIRLEIIPKLKEINEAAAANAKRFCDSLRADEEYLSDIAERFISENEADGGIPLSTLKTLPKPILHRVIIKKINEAETVHVEAVEKLLKIGKSHSSVSLPCECIAAIENGCLVFGKEQKKAAPTPFFVKIHPGENKVGRFLLEYSTDARNFHKSDTAATVSADKIVGEVVARNRAAGDKIKIGGVHKSIKKLMNEKKIPLELRGELPIICDGEGILFVPYIGLRDGAVCKNEKPGKIVSFSMKKRDTK